MQSESKDVKHEEQQASENTTAVNEMDGGDQSMKSNYPVYANGNDRNKILIFCLTKMRVFTFRARLCLFAVSKWILLLLQRNANG